ncbi:unnamed protein product [Clonostachys rosea]|uniref:Heterokaryon incompatibility domain-containing protein n=1 Tax=Bionectria ochroleuca TaxID=29856 RepID=A0ABY6V2M8_BIOOC|nr:unnamed protein product [Clonostachys rosea]
MSETWSDEDGVFYRLRQSSSVYIAHQAPRGTSYCWPTMWLSSKGKQPDYSKTKIGLDLQSICRGCTQIEILLDLHAESRKKGTPSPTGRLPFHNDFAEISECARRCHTCRVFRQALLTRCGTTDEADALAVTTRHCPVYVRPVFNYQEDSTQEDTSVERLESNVVFKIEILHHSDKAVLIPSSSTANSSFNLPENPNSPWIARQIKSWVEACHQDHRQSCAVLRWSSENPTRLIRIVSESELQLCSIDEQVQYAALSYCWGSQLLTEKDGELLRGAMTTMENLEQRYESFSISELPATLRDAITIFRRAGLAYAWIDSVCIIQGQSDMSDFIREAPRMHSYYGNASFTLAVCSNSRATEALLSPRSAFSEVTQSCHLRGRYLLPPLVTLAEMLKSSPLTKRSWTLQEEHLSPRVLYWTPNRIYWSCADAQLAETATPAVQPDLNDLNQDMPQTFLVACHHGTAETRHRGWLSLVTSYTLRDMSNPNDRFPALSGLASRYQSSCGQKNAYLSGLWELTLAHDLSWRVAKFVPRDEVDSSQTFPSWSWASLPLCHGIEYEAESQNPGGLEFVSSWSYDTSETDAIDDIYKGSRVAGLRVRARLRPFWHEEATLCPWDSILEQNANTQRDRSSMNPEFNFWIVPELPVYSTDPHTGLIVAYEARKKETVGQLDYISSVYRVLQGSLTIFALELTGRAFLLVEKIQDSRFRRVGIAQDYRSGFFDGVAVSDFQLV